MKNNHIEHTRRTALIALGTALASFTMPGCQRAPEAEKSAPEILRNDLGENIPAFENIELENLYHSLCAIIPKELALIEPQVVPVEAKYMLVNIKMIHPAIPILQTTHEIAQVQGQVKEVLLKMIEGLNVKGVYMDGANEELMTKLENKKTKTPDPDMSALNDLNDAMIDLSGDIIGKEEAEKLKARKYLIKAMSSLSSMLIESVAPVELYMAGRLEIYKTEQNETYISVVEYLAKGRNKPTEFDKEVFEKLNSKRLGAALNGSILSSDTTLKVSVFGTSDNFVEHVERFNELNPHKKVCLINLRPTRMPKSYAGNP